MCLFEKIKQWKIYQLKIYIICILKGAIIHACVIYQRRSISGGFNSSLNLSCLKIQQVLVVLAFPEFFTFTVQKNEGLREVASFQVQFLKTKDFTYNKKSWNKRK